MRSELTDELIGVPNESPNEPAAFYSNASEPEDLVDEDRGNPIGRDHPVDDEDVVDSARNAVCPQRARIVAAAVPGAP
jgi:hypothetical protein